MHQKIKFIPMKIQKIVSTRAAHFGPDMHQIVCRLGLRPRPHWGSLQRSPRPPSWIKGATSKGGEGKGTVGEGREGEGLLIRGGRGMGGEGMGEGLLLREGWGGGGEGWGKGAGKEGGEEKGGGGKPGPPNTKSWLRPCLLLGVYRRIAPYSV